MKNVGMEFLHACVQEPITELFESELSFELNEARGGKPENIKYLQGFMYRLTASIFNANKGHPRCLHQRVINAVLLFR
eukprot:m.334124 g.334124  ORF g.334124 m.334124 type:complete len:78 (-) comp16068_c0_seq8:643-876(-)